jgi:hypothetical protein
LLVRAKLTDAKRASTKHQSSLALPTDRLRRPLRTATCGRDCHFKLDIDASDVPLHGAQELSQFHAYYDQHCYLPLYVFCGQAMLACYLRPSKIDGAKHAAALIKLLLQWCERAGVGYVIGLARNARLHAAVELAEAALADAYAASGAKQRLIGEFDYAAKSWPHDRRVITRLEYGGQDS